jgi:hypothetical protein
VLIGQPARIAACQHGREELDTDHQANDQIAEPELVMDEQRDDRQRQADAPRPAASSRVH